MPSVVGFQVEEIVYVRQAGIRIRACVVTRPDGEFDAGYPVGAVDDTVVPQVDIRHRDVGQLISGPEILGPPNPLDAPILDRDDVIENPEFVVFDDVMECDLVLFAPLVFGWTQL